MPDADPLPLRVMAMHSLSYCERLYYLEEVEELRVADEAVHAGRELHEALAQAEEDYDHVQTLHLSSPALGLQGKVDAVKRRDGAWTPYEHKRGRCRRQAGPAGTDAGRPRGRAARRAAAAADGDGQAPHRVTRDSSGTPAAWDTDAVQVAAYAMLLEEHLGAEVTEGRVRYHADHVTVRVPIDDSLRAKVRATVARARQLAESLDRPPVTDNENLCRRCSLAPVCLPEEARVAEDPTRQVRHFAPVDDDRLSLHVVSPGARVGRSGLTLTVTPREDTTGQAAPPTRHPIRSVSAVLLHGQAQITTQALRLCANQDVAVHWLGTTGTHFGSLTTTVGQVQRRLRQYAALTDDAVRLRLAKALVAARIAGQHRYLLRATRGRDQERQSIRAALRDLAHERDAATQTADPDTLRGHEGAAARAYWSAFNATLNDRVPESLRYTGRTRRPPTDRLSALLNFGYGLLQTAVMRAALAAGLEPALGFYHTPRSAAHPLVLDLMEPFRVILWDMPLVASLNRGQWQPESHFDLATRQGHDAAVWLSESGRKQAIALFEQRLAEQWKHPVVGHTLTYRRTLELEARLLEKEWTGEPGLFAKLRLR